MAQSPIPLTIRGGVNLTCPLTQMGLQALISLNYDIKMQIESVYIILTSELIALETKPPLHFALPLYA